ncbi:MAG: GAF domain-containing protein [Candidatus Bipolaricaulota bacterium]|nr:MAG: GAF domain-containing protein [Candidatus Bipolaricaulota bacterium]
MTDNGKQGAVTRGEPFAPVLDAALAAVSADGFATAVSAALSDSTGSRGAAIYLADERIPAPVFASLGIDEPERLRALCAAAWEEAGSGDESSGSAEETDGALEFRALRVGDRAIGVIGLPSGGSASVFRHTTLEAWLPRLARLADNAIERDATTLRVRQLNAYFTISSSLGRALELSEAVEIALYCSMEVVDAEAASVLLLDEEKENLLFYSVEGPAQPVLQGASFPADRGISGAVLESLEAVIVDDVRGDPRFYGEIDTESGFETKNMIAVPLVAGEERVGVLELLNKAGGGPFVEAERLLLVAIADQIAYAIRNARIFECLVDSYCNRRKGIYSCKGCERPLGSWTPCMRYHDPNL